MYSSNRNALLPAKFAALREAYQRGAASRQPRHQVRKRLPLDVLQCGPKTVLFLNICVLWWVCEAGRFTGN